jgi:undecaprenyl-diphosphatase
MHFVIVVILGIVEGLTEFLPVSSTGHLLVAERLLGLGSGWEAFTVIIQLGAILAVIVYYFETFWKALVSLPTSAQARCFAGSVIVAFLPAAVIGLWCLPEINTVLLNPGIAMPVIAVTWFIGGVVILLLERVSPKPRWFDAQKLPLSKSFQIGLCQILSLIPGTSRSGATILGGELLGVERKTATVFTFYLAVPVMLGASVVEIHAQGAALSHGQSLDIAIGFLVSFVVAWFVIKGFLAIIGKYGLMPFGWYRVVAGIALGGALALHLV